MPLTDVRDYTELVREGDGNEHARLALLRRQRDRVTAQITQLTKSLDVIRYTMGVYEDILEANPAAMVEVDS